MLCDTPGQQLRYSSVISSRHLAMAHLPRQRPPSPSLWNLDTPGPQGAPVLHWQLPWRGPGLCKQHGLHPTVQFCCSSGRAKALTPASFLSVLMQSRAHTQMPLSYFLADPLTWFLGSLNTRVIKHCFIPGTKPEVYETLQIIIHFFFSSTHSLLIFQVCFFLQACSAWKIIHFCKFGQDLGVPIVPSAISWAGVLHR